MELENFVGRKFGRLVVQYQIENKTTHRGRMFVCLCDCGEEIQTRADSLKSGHTKSCGCVKRNDDWAINRVYLEYKHNAKKRGLVFDLSKEFFKKAIFKNCFYCGDTPSRMIRNNYYEAVLAVNGIDRTIASKGYVEENVVTACTQCNLLKSDLDIGPFLDWIKKVSRNSKKIRAKFF